MAVVAEYIIAQQEKDKAKVIRTDLSRSCSGDTLSDCVYFTPAQCRADGLGK